MRPPSTGGGPEDAPWADSWPAGVPRGYAYPEVGLCRLLDDAAHDFPETTAATYRGYALTYRKLADHVDRLATGLAELGIGRGDRVALVLPTCPQLVIALFAAWRLGAAVTLHRPADPGALDDPVPAAIVVLDRAYGRVAQVRHPSTRIIVTGRGDYLPFPRNVASPVVAVVRGRPLRIPETEVVCRLADLVRRNVPAPDAPADAPDAVALHVDGAAVSQHRLVVNSFQLRLWLPDVVAGDERVLLATPPSAPTVLWITMAVLSAATLVLVDDSRAARRQRAAFRAAPTLLPLDGRTTADLLRSSWRRGNLRSVRIAVTHDALRPSVVGQLEALTDKGRIRRAWGVRGVVTHADPVYGRAEPGAVGLPLPDTDAVVADAEGTPLPPGSTGRLWVRGPQLPPGWVDAGDGAVLGADGHLRVGGA